MLYPEYALDRSQDLLPVFYDAGQFYWGSFPAWREARPVFGPGTAFVEIPALRVLDIDTEEDWMMAELRYEILLRSGKLAIERGGPKLGGSQ